MIFGFLSLISHHHMGSVNVPNSRRVLYNWLYLQLFSVNLKFFNTSLQRQFLAVAIGQYSSARSPMRKLSPEMLESKLFVYWIALGRNLH